MYRYLGMIKNDRGNMDDHIKSLKGKTEAILQTILNIAGYGDCNKMNMDLIWRLTKACIIPTLTYGAEAWITTDSEIKQIQKILDNVIKRILKLPTTTPSECLMMETGIWNIQSIVNKKKMKYYHKIANQEGKSTTQDIVMDNNNEWNKNLQNLFKNYEIIEGDMLKMRKNELNRFLNKRIETKITDDIKKAADRKSKVKDLYTSKTHPELIRPAKYMENLSRMECSNIIYLKTRMIKVKGNYKNAHKDMKCRWCMKQDETQIHIFKECNNLKTHTERIKYDDIMTDQATDMKEEARKLAKVIEIINTQTHIPTVNAP
jgi:hypothetical protein